MDKIIGESNIPPNIIQAFDKLDICDLKCLKEKLCNKLHICPQFFYSGNCLYKADRGGSCRFGHNIHSTHNIAVLKQIGLEELTIEELRDRLKILKKHIPRIPICEQYLGGKVDHSADDCISLHICNNFLFRRCDGSCERSHDLSDLNCRTVLQCYGITTADIRYIHKDFQCSDHPLISRFHFDYRKKRNIASGGFGHVYEVEHIIDKKMYAVKCVMFSKNDIENVKREAELLANLCHENIVRYYTCWIENEMPVKDSKQDEGSSNMYGIQLRDLSQPSEASNICLQCTDDQSNDLNSEMEKLSTSTSEDEQKCLCIQMELCQYAHDEDYYTSDKIFKNLLFKANKFQLPLMDLILQLVKAVAYTHNQGIIHRDLKPDNIFLAREESYKVKVGDFGLARPVHSHNDSAYKYSPYVGTESYKSPEMVRGDNYDKSTDVYSLGLIILMMLYPMKTEGEWFRVLQKTRDSASPNFPTNIKDYPLLATLKDLLKRMLEADPKQRPDAETVEKELISYRKA